MQVIGGNAKQKREDRRRRREARRLARQGHGRGPGRRPHEGGHGRGVRRHADELPRPGPRHAQDGLVLRRHPPRGRQRQDRPDRARRTAASRRRGSRCSTRRRSPARWWTPCRTSSSTRTAAPSRRSTASCPPSSRMRTLQRMKVDLADVQKKRTNLNAAELGDAKDRAKQWKRYDRNPVFDEAEVKRMTDAGVTALTNMQCGDGGWGWFSGCGEHSWPHTTAVVVHGLQIARENDIALVPNVLERGIAWLKNYQAEQVQHDQERPGEAAPVEGARRRPRRDGLHGPARRGQVATTTCASSCTATGRTLAVYAKAMFGLALHKEKQAQKLDMVLREHRAVRRRGRGEPDGVPEAARGQRLVVLVRQRDRGERLLPQAALEDQRRRTRRRPGWSSTCWPTASTRPTGAARATRPSASRRWPTTSRPRARTSRT